MNICNFCAFTTERIFVNNKTFEQVVNCVYLCSMILRNCPIHNVVEGTVSA